ncbi:alpha/beta hydrolase [Paraglaciecola aquimarina]|uniref:Alpha/beta hydrolase n=1 Tax=Paraglaciecola aquimarina TaxID=1235557 RepID=A0ABU3SYF0_9ALTE|nr:alpha/beta hydrolase [Paraglaciecola aquimarina]MDU0355025.1 alpha/beta hydrolase [Paraglaciecola aquimarina]
MKKIQFAHANGFPARCYEYFFSLLENVEVDFINTMGHAGYSGKQNLTFLRDELIDYIVQNNAQPVIGMGHSAGASATLLAAAERPELFEEVILIDPVALGSHKRFIIKLSQMLGLWERFSPAKKTRRRRYQFTDQQQAFSYYQQKLLFKHFHKHSYQSYINHGLKPAGDNVELTFSRQVEADIFRHAVTRLPKDLSKVKGTIIYAKHSNVFGPSDAKWWQKKHPHFNLLCFDGYHLFPLEQPEKAAQQINQLLT